MFGFKFEIGEDSPQKVIEQIYLNCIFEILLGLRRIEEITRRVEDDKDEH